MIKKLGIFTCIMFMFLLCGAKSANAADSILAIDLDSAITRALSQNRDLYLINQKISLATEKYDEASGGIDSDKKLKALNDLIDERESEIKDIKLNVTKLYYQILIKQKQVTLQEEIVSRLSRELDMKKKMVELGKDTEASVLNAEISLNDGKSKLSDIKADIESNIMDLNIEMGDPIDNKLSLTEENIPEDTLKVDDIDKLSEDMVSESYSVSSISMDLSINSEEIDSATGSAKDSLENKELDLINSLEDEKVSVEYKVRSDYNTVLNKRDDAESKRLDYVKLMKQSDISRIKLEFGMATALEYDKAREDAQNSLYIYMQSRLDYYIEIRKYKNFIQPAVTE